MSTAIVSHEPVPGHRVQQLKNTYGHWYECSCGMQLPTLASVAEHWNEKDKDGHA